MNVSGKYLFKELNTAHYITTSPLYHRKGSLYHNIGIFHFYPDFDEFDNFNKKKFQNDKTIIRCHTCCKTVTPDMLEV